MAFFKTAICILLVFSVVPVIQAEPKRVAPSFNFSELYKDFPSLQYFDACFLRQLIAHVKNPCQSGKTKVPFSSILKQCPGYMRREPSLGLSDKDRDWLNAENQNRKEHIIFLQEFVPLMRKKICSNEVDAQTCASAVGFLTFLEKSKKIRSERQKDSWAFKEDIHRAQNYLKRCDPKNQEVNEEPEEPLAVSSTGISQDDFFFLAIFKRVSLIIV